MDEKFSIELAKITEDDISPYIDSITYKSLMELVNTIGSRTIK